MNKKIVYSIGFVACLTILAVSVSVLILHFCVSDYRLILDKCRKMAGKVVVDRNGRLLRLTVDQEDHMSRWTNLADFPEWAKSASIAVEDSRFYSHPGFDPIAMVRSIKLNVEKGKTVSGASTITQQVVRLLEPRPRTYRSKFIEIISSVKMELQLSKNEILELYLNMVPMGGNIRGMTAAAYAYFGKDVRLLNPGEAALLAAIPKSPSRFDPRKVTGRHSVMKRKDLILGRMCDLGYISSDVADKMRGPLKALSRRPFPFEAPHFVDLVISKEFEKQQILKTTLDLDLQHDVEEIARAHRKRLAAMGVHQLGILAVSKDGEVLAMLGSLGYQARDQGFNNAVVARRSAASTLKPFLYALAFEKGYNPSCEVADTFRSYSTPRGDYLPVNADRRSYGPVTLRLALGNSLNVSAIKVLNTVGLNSFYLFLTRAGIFGPQSPSPAHYGLGLAIGNVEVSLYELVQAYTAFPNGGVCRSLRIGREETGDNIPLMSEESAFMVSHILSDPTARMNSFGNPGYFDFGFPVSLKTGTSTNFRDVWIIGYTPDHVVGIWAGNFDSQATRGATGAIACGPILHDIFRRLYGSGSYKSFPKPRRVTEKKICSMSGKLAAANCLYTTTEIFDSGKPFPETCPLSHQSPHHHLGGLYAQWIQRREVERVGGRFRLANPPNQIHPLRYPNTLEFAGNFNRPFGQASLIEIVSPHERDRFVRYPQTKQTILFRAIPDPPTEYVIWLLDGKEIARTQTPYEFLWESTRGEHVLHAVTPQDAAAKITFTVE